MIRPPWLRSIMCFCHEPCAQENTEQVDVEDAGEVVGLHVHDEDVGKDAGVVYWTRRCLAGRGIGVWRRPRWRWLARVETATGRH